MDYEIAVSYTHLDVYKRQEVSREEWKIMPNQEITGLALFFCAKILIFS